MTEDATFFHITTALDAERLERDGQLEPPSLATEGFVHCSTGSEVVATTERYYPADAELVLLELDGARIEAEVRWPEVYPGRRFPHVHAPLAAEWVVSVLPWGPSDRAQWSGASSR